MILRGLVLGFLLLLNPAVWAASSKDITVAEKRVALVIGNANYPTAPLKNPVNDARAMAAALRAQGFTVIARENATKAIMEKAVIEFGQSLSEGGTGLVYYSGHGMQVNGRNYLIPVDADIANERMVPLTTVDSDNIIGQMVDAKSRVNLVILDACRNNPFERRFRALGGGLATIDAPQGTLIAYATAPGKVASDGTGANGLYTQELLRAMRQPGLKVEEVFKQVRVAVAAASNNAQTPWEASSLTGDFYFGGAPAGQGAVAVAPPVTSSFDPLALELSFWETIKSSTDPEDFKAYLEQFPKGRFAGLARSRSVARPAPTPAPAPAPQQQQVAMNPVPVPQQAPSNQAASRAVGAKFRDCRECPEVIVIPSGSFMMGSLSGESGREGDEGPQHRVTISRPLAVGIYDVTFAEWDACVANGGCNGYRPDDSSWGRGTRPVMNVSWDDAQNYVQWLNRKIAQEAGGRASVPAYRLPTEAEWEYAARAGTTTPYYWGSSIGRGNANCEGCGSQWDNAQSSPSGSFPPNPWGLYDMAGTMWQWVEDCYHKNYEGAPTDGSAWKSGCTDEYVHRGGTWFYKPDFARAGERRTEARGDRSRVAGFRVVRNLD